MQKFDVESLKRWFQSEQRDLPWRHNRSPYTVWVSEMMLQQTQVSVVIAYFERWMLRFPTIKHLAEASLDQVIKVWEGLGYYSRARYLHEGAKYIVEHHQGVFPDDVESLKKIKGLGDYTTGAILSFAFHKKAPAVDGNVLRVLSRYYLIEEDISKQSTQKAMRELALNLLPAEEPWVINEALIELGATICTRQPKCAVCPLRNSCQGYAQDAVKRLPFKSAKVKIESLYRDVAVIKFQDAWLIKRGIQGEIMSDLHEFPYFDSTKTGSNIESLEKLIESELNCKVVWGQDLPLIKHSFTRYRVHLMPKLFTSKKMHKVPSAYQWLKKSELEHLAFSSGHRRILGGLGGFAP